MVFYLMLMIIYWRYSTLVVFYHTCLWYSTLSFFVYCFGKTCVPLQHYLCRVWLLLTFFTALTSYGFQPLFQNRYKCYHTDVTDSYACDLPYPYCSVAVYLSISSIMFHTVSNLFTTFLGMQRVIAIMFPIWTKFHLTNRKAVTCCFMTFLLCVPFSVPRYFVLGFQYDPTIWCTILPNNIWLFNYSSMYYLFIHTILTTSCCVIMIMSAFFIVFKLVNNTFSGRMTEHGRQERRSVVIVVLVLIVFLITEIPKYARTFGFVWYI